MEEKSLSVGETGKSGDESQSEVDATKPVVKILAWDYSGSTSNMPHYHQHGNKYLQKFSQNANSADEPIYLRWSDQCDKISLGNLESIIENRDGSGGTYPSTIIEWILKNLPKEKPIELWLITDGEIYSDELKKCPELNKQVNYSSINFIVINKNRINMSVGASFFRGARIRIFYNDALMKEINTAKPFDYDSITVDNFDVQWDILSDFIQAKFMGSDLEGLEEAEKLSALRRRLLKVIASQDTTSSNSKYPAFPSKKKSDLLLKLRSCQFYRRLTNSSVKDAGSKVDGSISTLINYIHNKHKSYDFEALKVDYRQDKMSSVDIEPEPELDSLDDCDVCGFFDAVTLEDEHTVPVLLLPVKDLIQKYWIKGNYSKFRIVTECPLMAKMDDCIGHVFTYDTFKALWAEQTGVIVNPLTNETGFGGLIFDERADDWNDYVLTMSFFRGKKVSTCLPLWYYVIWENAKNKSWITPGVADLLKSYAFRRMGNSKVRLAFSSLPLDPQEMVPLPVACFYCTEGSSLLFGENRELFLHERLRQYWSVAKSMLHILQHFGYEEVDEEFVVKRGNVFETMANLKRIPQEIEKLYFVLGKAFESQGAFLTYVIKDKGALKYLNLLQYHHKTSLIPFDFDQHQWDFRLRTIVTYDYAEKVQVKLCTETLRPFFVVATAKNDLVPYYNQVMDCVTDTVLGLNGEIASKRKVKRLNQNKIMSMNKLYIDVTNELGRFPTLSEYTEYTSKVKRISGGKVRLFSPLILSEIQRGFDFYKSLGVEIKEFIKKTHSSIPIVDRIRMEKMLIRGNVEEFVNKAKAMLESYEKAVT